MSYKTLYICIACSLISVCANANEITRPNLMVPEKLGNVRLFHQDNNFIVERDGQEKTIQPCFVSTDIRNISPELLGKFIAADNYLKLSELKRTDDSVDYKLNACNRLRGGGAGGAAFGVFLGQALVWGTCHTVAGAAAFFGTPAAGVAVETGISVGSPFIEAAALKASLALGIIFGAATGPV